MLIILLKIYTIYETPTNWNSGMKSKLGFYTGSEYIYR